MLIKRPVVIASIGFIIGILWGLYNEISIIPIFLFVFFVLAFIMSINKKAKRYIKVLVKDVCIVFMVFSIMGYLYMRHCEKQKEYDDKENVIFDCIVLNEPQETLYYYVYETKIQSGVLKGKKVLLRIKKNKNNEKIEYGTKLSINGEYRKPQSQRNEYGFDYEKYLKSKGIYGSVITQKNKVIIKKKDTINPLLIMLHNVKNNIKEKLNAWLSKDNSSLMIGILLGEKTYLTDETVENFTNSNLSHLLVVSGAHISYIILGISLLLGRINFSKKKTYTLTVIVLMLFATMVGLSPSVVRATTMGIFIIIGKIIYRKSDFLTSMAISIFIILLSNPYSILDIGLQLSYLATLGIVLFYPIVSSKLNTKESKIKYFKEIIAISISAQILIIPIVIINYHKISLNFIVSNILTTPLFAISIIYGLITILTGSVFEPLGKVISIFLNIDLEILKYTTKIIGNIKIGNILAVKPNIIIVLMYYALFFIIKCVFNISHLNRKRNEMTNIEKKKSRLLYKIYSKKRRYIKILSGLLVFILIFTFVTKTIIPQNLIICFIDVGQGDACLIQTPNHKKILIDGGGNSDGNDYNVGKNILIPFLLNKQIDTIDYIIVSHFDTDHVGRDTYSYGRT